MSSSADEYDSADEDSLDSGNCSPLYSDENDFEEGKKNKRILIWNNSNVK